MDSRQPQTRAKVEQTRHHPRIDIPQHHLGQGGTGAEQRGGQQGKQDTGPHGATVAHSSPRWRRSVVGLLFRKVTGCGMIAAATTGPSAPRGCRDPNPARRTEMSACAMLTYNNVSPAAWQAIKQQAAAKYNVLITTDSGSA